MTPDHSRRNFLRYVPGAFLLFASAGTARALPALQQTPPTTSSGSAPVHPTNNSGMGGPGPAQHGGDYQPQTISGPYDRKKDKDPAPHKPRKDLAADQKTLRDEVRQLAMDTQELSKAIAQTGPTQALPAELVGKTKEIEKLAHDIAVLAKG